MGQLSMSAAVDVDLDGTRVATWVMEPPAGIQPVRDIVICHGTPWSSTMWAATAQLLSAENRVHLWDMPGYGASIDAAAPASDLISQRRRLTALLDHWALDTPHIIAHDIGGAVALGAHLLDGVEFASLYLADVVTLEPWGSPFFQLVAEHEAVFSALPPQLHAALVREYIAGAAGPHLDTAWISKRWPRHGFLSRGPRLSTVRLPI